MQGEAKRHCEPGLTKVYVEDEGVDDDSKLEHDVRMRAVNARAGPDPLVHPGAGQLHVEHRRLRVEDEGVPRSHRRHPRLLPPCSPEEGTTSGRSGAHATPSPRPAHGRRQRACDSRQLGRFELGPIDRQLPVRDQFI